MLPFSTLVPSFFLSLRRCIPMTIIFLENPTGTQFLSNPNDNYSSII